MTFSERAKSAVRAIVSVFETGKADGDYSAVAVLADGAGISYGAHQATHRSGSLALVVAEYLKAVPDSPIASYLPELRNKDDASVLSLSRNNTLKAALRQAGRSAEMKVAQNTLFDKKYMQPAISAAEGSGFKHPLTLAVIYDSKIQGSYDRVRDRVPAGLTEQAWAKRFIAERRSFLANNRKSIVRGTVYRPDALSKLAEAGNWNLTTPFTVRGVRITNEIVGHADDTEGLALGAEPVYPADVYPAEAPKTEETTSPVLTTPVVEVTQSAPAPEEKKEPTGIRTHIAAAITFVTTTGAGIFSWLGGARTELIYGFFGAAALIGVTYLIIRGRNSDKEKARQHEMTKLRETQAFELTKLQAQSAISKTDNTISIVPKPLESSDT